MLILGGWQHKSLQWEGLRPAGFGKQPYLFGTWGYVYGGDILGSYDVRGRV